jgi:hypothetical protein
VPVAVRYQCIEGHEAGEDVIGREMPTIGKSRWRAVGLEYRLDVGESVALSRSVPRVVLTEQLCEEDRPRLEFPQIRDDVIRDASVAPGSARQIDHRCGKAHECRRFGGDLLRPVLSLLLGIMTDIALEQRTVTVCGVA